MAIKSFPIEEEVVIGGKEYIIMDIEVFKNFFDEILKYKEIDKEFLFQVEKKWEYANRIKRKRIRKKKVNEVVQMMYFLLLKEDGNDKSV